MQHASKICCLTLTMLIVLPVTAPFQTVSMAQLLHGEQHETLAIASQIARSTPPVETLVSPDPPYDGTGCRLKLESRSVRDALNAVARRPSRFAHPVAAAPAGILQVSSTILRL